MNKSNKILLVLSILMLFPVASALDSSLYDGLDLLVEGGTYADSSTNALPFTNTNVVTVIDDLYGEVYDFDFNAEFNLGTPTELDFGTGDFTMTININFDTIDYGQMLGNVVGNTGIAMFPQGDYMSAWVGGSVSAGEYSSNAVGYIQILGGVWYEVTITKVGNTHSIYVNGILQNTHTQDYGTITPINDFTIGNGDWGYMDAKVSQVRIYSRGLSDAEVLLGYNTAYPQPTTEYFRFEDNNCVSIELTEIDVTSNDYNTLIECEDNIQTSNSNTDATYLVTTTSTSYQTPIGNFFKSILNFFKGLF